MSDPRESRRHLQQGGALAASRSSPQPEQRHAPGRVAVERISIHPRTYRSGCRPDNPLACGEVPFSYVPRPWLLVSQNAPSSDVLGLAEARTEHDKIGGSPSDRILYGGELVIDFERYTTDLIRIGEQTKKSTCFRVDPFKRVRHAECATQALQSVFEGMWVGRSSNSRTEALNLCLGAAEGRPTPNRRSEIRYLPSPASNLVRDPVDQIRCLCFRYTFNSPQIVESPPQC